jgi:nitrite reductase/ring-hydroxylating ferredoxin subunit
LVVVSRGKDFISVVNREVMQFLEVTLMMGFVKAASTKILEPGNMMAVEVGGKEVFLVNLGGKYYAIGNRCTHMSCMLSDGTLRGENVTCTCHGSIFEIKTGNVVKGPAKKPEPVFQVKVEGDQILVNV